MNSSSLYTILCFLCHSSSFSFFLHSHNFLQSGIFYFFIFFTFFLHFYIFLQSPVFHSFFYIHIFLESPSFTFFLHFYFFYFLHYFHFFMFTFFFYIHLFITSLELLFSTRFNRLASLLYPSFVFIFHSLHSFHIPSRSFFIQPRLYRLPPPCQPPGFIYLLPDIRPWFRFTKAITIPKVTIVFVCLNFYPHLEESQLYP